jgi:hypothetical protein
MEMTNLMAVSREDGVKDLPLRVRKGFAKALLAERQGDTANAALFLDEALVAEASIKG